MQTPDQLLRRIEVVKSLLEIGDFETASMQMERIPTVPGADLLLVVREHLASSRWNEAHRDLIAWLASQTRLTEWQDPRIMALKAELSYLQDAIADAETEKASVVQCLHLFEVTYRQKLGDLIQELLRLRSEKLSRQAESDETHRQASQKAAEEAKSFEQSYNEARKLTRVELTEEEAAEIKSLYRKASKLCHPDMVRHELKQAAQKMFQRLSEAYENQDIKALRELLAQLEAGDFGDEQAIERAEQSPAQLAALVESLRQKLAALQAELETLRTQASYEIATDESGWGSFFATQRNRLENEIARLQLS